MSMDFFSAGGFIPHTMYYCVRLALVPCFMRKHLEPLAELEDGCRVRPWLQAWGCSRKNMSLHDSSALSYLVAACGIKCVWLMQALPCVLIRQSTCTFVLFFFLWRLILRVKKAITRNKWVFTLAFMNFLSILPINSWVTEAKIPTVKDTARNAANLGPDPFFTHSSFA